MNKLVSFAITAALAAAVFLPAPALYAAPARAAHTARNVAVVYQCAKCHMKFSAAQAKKDHFVDPMDGGKLVPVKPAAGKKKTSIKPMTGMKM